MVNSYEPDTTENPSRVDDTMGSGDEAREEEFIKTWTAAIHWMSAKLTEMTAKHPEWKNFMVWRREGMYYREGFYDALNLLHEWKKI